MEIVRQQRLEAQSDPVAGLEISVSEMLEAQEKGYVLQFDQATQSYFLVQPREHFVLRLSNESLESAQIEQLEQLLGVVSSRRVFDIDPVVETDRDDTTREDESSTLRIKTRSVLGAMSYLALAVEVPADHLAAGMADRMEPGAPQGPRQGRLRVRVSSDKPAAALAVPFRGFWYFVADDDLDSKRTLSLLDYLFRLTLITPPEAAAPVLTLPVGR